LKALSSPSPVAPSRRELYFVWALIVAAVALTAVPDIYGWLKSTPSHVFVGYASNVDDAYVYLSWTRQAADGHFFARNLFTTEPRLGHQFNVYFLLLGNACRILHLPIVIGSFVARLAFGVSLLWLIYRFYLWAAPGSASTRCAAFSLCALGTGGGWVYLMMGIHKPYWQTPVDIWQPEAFTFLSILAAGLFSASTLLIVSVIFLLLRAEEHSCTRDAVFAGICALVLGNIHSYDVLHIAGAWGLYLVVRQLSERRVDWASWRRAVLAGAVCSPSVAYQLFELTRDHVLQTRAAAPTPTPEFLDYVLGYGLTLVFAVLAVVLLIRSKMFRSIWRNKNVSLMLICWVVAVFVLAYVPCSFQRKMIMGLHVPLCLLAGSAAVFVGQACAARFKTLPAGLVPALVVLVSLPTGLISIGGILHHIDKGDSDMQSPSFLTADEIHVFDWVRQNTRPSDSFFGPPPKMLFLPAYCDRRVWCGHWSETPDYIAKLREGITFSRGQIRNEREFLVQTGAQYLIWPARIGSGVSPNAMLCLKPVYGNATYTIYRIL